MNPTPAPLSPDQGLSTRAILALFGGAWRCARLVGQPVATYPVPLTTLLQTGASPQELSRLIQIGYIRPHSASRISPPHAPSHATAWGPRCAFALTANGEAWVKRSLKSCADVMIEAGPSWCASSRELTYQGVLVKRFRRPAENQFLVLDSFEELKWARQIDDPLPPSRGMIRGARLEETVKSLNRLLFVPLLRFSATADRRAVRWHEGIYGTGCGTKRES